MNIVNNKKILLTLAVCIAIVLFVSITFYIRVEEKIKFRNSARNMNGDFLIMQFVAVNTFSSDSDFQKSAGDMMDSNKTNEERLVSANHLLSLESSLRQQGENAHAKITFNLNTDIATLYQASSAIKESGFRNDALHFTDFAKSQIKKDENLYTVWQVFFNLNINLAKSIVQHAGDNTKTKFSDLGINSNDEMSSIFQNMGVSENDALKAEQEIENQYAILQGKYGLKDLTFSDIKK